MKRLISSALLLTAGLLAQSPVVNSVNNAGSYGTDIAQGSIFVIFGSNLGPAALTQSGALPLETALAGTSVRFTPTAAGGAAVNAFMVYTSSGQVAALLPSNAAVGDHNVTVSYNGATSAPVRARVVQRAYGMITLNSRGSGLAVIQNASDANRVNQFTAPVRPGQVMVLWGTGLGPVSVPDNQAPGAQDLKGPANVKVLVGGVEVEPLYAGRSPGLPGADQINFTIPSNAPTGCNVSLRVSVGGQIAPPASIAIAPGGRAVCEHPVFSEETLRKIDAGGAGATYGSFALTSFGFSIALTGLPIQLPPIDVKTDAVGGSFTRLTLANFEDVSSELAPEVGGCRVVKQRFDQTGSAVVENRAVALDAGTITMNGPNVNNRALTNTRNYYNLLITDPSNISLPGLPGGGGGAPAAGIAAGTYTLTGTGGTDVGPFTAQVRLSGIPTWTNKDAITAVDRSRPLQINWSGAAADDLVVINGVAGTAAASSTSAFDGTVFTCIARGNANSFSVPVSVLEQMPAVAGISFSGTSLNTTSIGLLTVSASNANSTNGRFSAPLRAGGNIDFGFFTYSFGGSKSLPYR